MKASAKDNNGISAQDARKAVETLLKYIGEDPLRDGLLDTPNRFCRSLLEMTEGYAQTPEDVLTTTFEAEFDEMVILKDIAFSSMCEHHLLSFTGKAHIAYLPSNGRIVGLSKLARLVDLFAKRLQVQERLTKQIADSLETILQPKGVGVVIEGIHSCMCVRGIKKHNSVMITSSMNGEFKHSLATRNEFMELIRR
jgi:GTP cyclohydrolase I